MAPMSTGLTKTEIDAAIAAARGRKGPQIELRDIREPGLRFRAGERSAKWSLVIRIASGTRSRVALGSWPGLGISEARRAARDMRRRIEEGGDPNEEKRTAAREAQVRARSRRSLIQVLDEYERAVLAHHRRGDQTRRALDGEKGLLRTLVTREPHSITRTEMAEIVKRRARQSPISANRQLAYAKAFFNWCVSEEILEANPILAIKRPVPERVRDRYHSLGELRELWSATSNLGYPFQYLYRLLIVLPMRREEVAAMPVAELSLDGDEPVWVLPAERTKRANALRVPLLPLARSIIKEALASADRPKDAAFVFSTTGDTSVSGFTKGKRRWDAAVAAARAKAAKEIEADAEAMPHWTLHDLRTTFNTHACERLKVDAAVADRILNHVATATTSKIMRVYNKSELFEERKVALQAWERLLSDEVV
jgi:integrase